MNSVLALWKKASIPQRLINHRDHTLLLCAVTVEENTNPFQSGSSTQSFSLLRTFFSGQVPSSGSMWSEADPRQSQFMSKLFEYNVHSEAATGMETSKNKALPEKKPEEKQTKGLDSFQRKARVTLERTA